MEQPRETNAGAAPAIARPMKRLFLVYSLPVILAVCLASVFDVFLHPNLFLLDTAFQWRNPQEPRDEIAIVAISKQDFDLGAPRWPWPRSLAARLIDEVSAYRPAVIAVDILYTESSNTETLIDREKFADIQPFVYQALSGVDLQVRSAEGNRKFGSQIVSGREPARAQDQELADAVQRAIGNGVDVVLAAQIKSTGSAIGLAEPFPALADAADHSLGLVGVATDADGALRHYLPYGRDKDGRFVYGLALAAVAKYESVELPETPLPNGDVPIGDSLLTRVTDGRFLVNFNGPPGTHPTFSAGEILQGDVDYTSQLKDKIVFIGVTDPSLGDLYATPFSGIDQMAGVEFQSAAADTILSGAFIRTAPPYQEILMLLVFGLGSIALGRFMRPVVGFTGALVLAAGLVGIWFGSFVAFNYVVPISASFAVILVGYTVAATDRMWVEQVHKQHARAMFSRYLHPAIVKQMLRDPLSVHLGGRRTELTVLFSDIRGFTALSERMAPEDVVDLINEYLSIMTEVIFRYEGTIDKFQGDGILAFFGAPDPHTDDPERAVRAALEMRDRLTELEPRWRELTQSPLAIGIGINTGQAVVGNIGSQRRMDYTVIGDTVNMASRLQELTKKYGAPILISDRTQAKVTDTCDYRFLGSVQVAGRQQPVGLYEVVGLKSEVLVRGGTDQLQPALG